MASTDEIRPSLPRQNRQDGHRLTIVEGDTALITFDPLISVETAQAVLALYYEHRPHKLVRARQRLKGLLGI